MRMPDQIQNNMFAPCGMNCMVCYAHLKKKKPCSGCLSDDENKPERCKACVIKSCAFEKGFVHCLNCSEFPCIKIKNLDKSYRKRYDVSLVENSNFVKKKNMKLFLKDEVFKWKCNECGGVISLHDKACSECWKE